jgi:hypothetical protein
LEAIAIDFVGFPKIFAARMRHYFLEKNVPHTDEFSREKCERRERVSRAGISTCGQRRKLIGNRP